MTIKLNLKFIISFLSLTFLMHEAHEIVHTTVGRLICGCWGQRDFNVWGLCEGCSEKHPISLLSTFAGPIFTFIIICVGATFLKSSNTDSKKSLGFALVFSNLPFARILTASMGGGDEAWGLNQLTHNYTLSWAVALGLILLITTYPLYKAYKTIHNKKRIWLFILFFLTPTFIDLIVVLGLMNTLLTKGILSSYWILGSPILVTVWTALVFSIFILTRKYIYKLGG